MAFKFITEGGGSSQAPYNYYGQGRVLYVIERSPVKHFSYKCYKQWMEKIAIELNQKMFTF